MTAIAKSTLWCGNQGEPRKRITISLGLPERDPQGNGSYRCLVKKTGLNGDRYVYGEDSLQALLLAIGFLKKQIKAFQRKGLLFFYTKTDLEPVDLGLIWFGQTRRFMREIRARFPEQFPKRR